MTNPERIVQVSDRVASVASRKISEINGVTSAVRMLALNGLIEASRAGELGRGAENFVLRTDGKPTGYYTLEDQTTVGFALTPGYETYGGLGWYGAIVLKGE